MTEENVYKTIQVEGTLEIPGTEGFYYLMSGRPLPKDSWMRDGMEMFEVVQKYGRPFHLVVNGPFVLSYLTSGDEIKIQKETEELEILDPLWLKKLYSEEPASLMEAN